MESDDIQRAVKNNHENSDGPTKINRDLCRVVLLTTIKSWIQILNKTGSINLSHAPGCRCTVRAKGNISKTKYRLVQKQ